MHERVLLDWCRLLWTPIRGTEGLAHSQRAEAWRIRQQPDTARYDIKMAAAWVTWDVRGLCLSLPLLSRQPRPDGLLVFAVMRVGVIRHEHPRHHVIGQPQALWVV